MRALAVVVTLALAGCGSDKATTPIGADMSAAVGLNDPNASLCAKPCLLLAPDCPTGQQCHELHPGDGGIAQVIIEGNGCATTATASDR